MVETVVAAPGRAYTQFLLLHDEDDVERFVLNVSSSNMQTSEWDPCQKTGKESAEMMKELKLDPESWEEVVEQDPLHGLRFVMCSSVHSRCTVN